MLSQPIMTLLLAFYALTFFLLWAIIAILTKKDSSFTISKTLWLIAGFGLSHGTHEWAEFFEIQYNLRLDAIDAVSLAISYYFLIQFSISTLVIAGKQNRLWHLIALVPVMLWFLLVERLPHDFMISQIGDVYARYVLGGLGCFLTSLVLFFQRAQFKRAGQADIIRSLYITSAGFIFYGMVSGLIVPDVPALQPFLPTYTTFYQAIGLPVQLFRTVAIVIIGFAMIRLLRVFEWEKMSTLMRAKTELEEKVEERTAELAKTNEKLKLIIETEPECVKLLSGDGALVQMNRAGLSLLDAEFESQIMGKKMYDMIAVQYRQDFKDLTDRVFHGGSGTLEFEAIGLKGRRVWLETHAAPLRNERNEIIAALGITRDISARKKAEDLLQQSEKQLSESQRIAHIGSWERNLATGALFWSDELFRIFRLDPKTDRVDFNKLLEMIHRDDRPAFKRAVDETIRSNKPYSIDYRIVFKDGTIRIIHAEAELRRDETGTQAILTGTAQDITERRLAELKVQQNEAKYRNLFESSMDGLFILDLDGNFVDVNSTAYTRLGYTKEEILALHISKLDHPEFASRVPERLKQIREQGFAVFESAHLRKDGTAMPVEINSRLIEYEGRMAYLSVIRDITERKKAELELRELNRDFVIFLESTTDFVYFKDSNSRFRFCSQTLANITGHASWRDMIGKHDMEVFPEDVAKIYSEEELPVFLQGIPLLNKTDPYYDAQGRMGWVSTSKWPVFDDDSRVIGIFGISRDITEQKKMEEEIRHMAQHDALTDLPNRRLLQEIIKIETAQAKRHQTKMALLLMDLDRFKEVNDTLGHDVGDELLKDVSARFRANIRESDTVSRTGGDEFTFVVADINKAEDAADVAQKIVASLKKPFFVSGHELYITTSLGISVYPDDGEEIDTLIRYADIAMYYAKEQGRNTFQFYNHAINIRTVERIRLESMLRQTVERGELAVYYQPQIDINSRKMICSEALVRWNHPALGLLEAKRFMGMAEETGYVTVIDEWVLRTVCAQVRKWLDAGLEPVRITVNLSAREFQNPNLVQKIATILKEADTPPEYVDIEITESLAMSNISRTVYRLQELAKMGVRALIDDFGTGYSSLSQLKRLPIQKLKIDQSFIEDIATDPDDRAIISAVTSMAHSMSMRVVAEGVETDAQLSFLRTTHCDEAQGYLFSRALPAREFEHAFLTR